MIKKGGSFFQKYFLKRREFLVGLLIISFLLPYFSLAATLRLSPSSGSYDVGRTFTVNLLVDSSEPMNTAGAALEYDPSKIRVSNVSKSDSLFSMWPEEPDYSNSAGTINFGGGMPGDQFEGNGGNIISITFRAESEGEASVSFSNGQVIFAGNDITDDLQGATYSFTDSTPDPEPEPDPEPDPEPTPTDSDIDAPKINSSTHKEDQWVADSNPVFDWDVPSTADAVRIQVGREDTTPTVVYDDPIIEERELEDLDDGVWYFTAQFREGDSWGEIGSFKFKIDTEPPREFDLEVDDGGDSTNPTPRFLFESSDQTSGIADYEIKLNDELYDSVSPDDLNDGYVPSVLDPGDYYLTVDAYDMAGNSTSDSLIFTVKPLELSLEDYPTILEEGEKLVISGKTIPEATVKIYMEKGEEETIEEVIADKEGKFSFKKELPNGKHRIWVQAEDERGAKSLATEKKTVEVNPDRLVVILTVVLTILILAGLGIIYYLKKKIAEEQRKLEEENNKETIEVKREAYNLLEKRIREQVEQLEEKVDLSRSESKLLEDLRESLKVSKEARTEDQNEEDNN